MDPSSTQKIVARVLLSHPTAPNADALIEQLQAATGAEYRTASFAGDAHTARLRLDDDDVVVRLVPSPPPWSQLARPCASASSS